jgi:multidrug efflux pump subunit AcrB
MVYVGEGGPRFYLALDPADAAPSTAFILVQTRDLEASLELVDRARRHLVEQFPEARFRVKRLSMGASEGGVVDVEITGRDGERLLELARQVESAFHGLPGLVENQNDWGEKIVKVVVDVDQYRARRLGISSASLSRVLGAYLDGYPVSEFRAGDETVPILLRARESDRDSIADLTNLSVLDDAGEVVPLDQVAVIRPILDFSRIRRHDQQRMITVTAKSDRLTADALVDQVRDRLREIDGDSDASVAIAGEIEDQREIYGRIAAGLPAAFTLMLLLVILQFDSFRRALILFASVPLILIGAPLGLLLGGHPMSFMGTLGLISLAGIIINNGIVLIDQIDLERNRTEDRTRAVITAAGRRAGPILLTSVTTVVGLVPLYLFGGPLWEPLAVVIIGGLSVASVTSLLFIPAAYALLAPPLRPHPGAEATAADTSAA